MAACVAERGVKARFMETVGARAGITPSATRILLVDDERMVLRALRRVVLSRHPDWEVLCARSADAALRLLVEQAPVHVMVTDLNMARFDGIVLLSIIRERHPEVARVVHSAHIESFGRRTLGELCHQLLAKPAPAAELVSALELMSSNAQHTRFAG